MSAPAVPVPDKGWVTISLRGGLQVVEHHGTGERVVLDPAGSASEYTLAFSTTEEGVLLHPDKEPVLVSSSFKKALFRAVRKGYHEMQLFIAWGAASTWQSAELEKCDTLCFYNHHPADAPFNCEVFRYNTKRGPAYLWWGMQRVKAYVFPDIKSHNWHGKNHLS